MIIASRIPQLTDQLLRNTVRAASSSASGRPPSRAPSPVPASRAAVAAPGMPGASTQGGIAMFACTICRFATELDDVVVALAGDRCVCLRCYGRETASALRMPTALRRDVSAALAAI